MMWNMEHGDAMTYVLTKRSGLSMIASVDGDYHRIDHADFLVFTDSVSWEKTMGTSRPQSPNATALGT